MIATLRVLAGWMAVSTLCSVSWGQEVPESRGTPVAMSWAAPHRLLVALRDAKQVAVVDPRLRATTTTWQLKFQPHALSVDTKQGDVIVGGLDGEVALLTETGSVRWQSRIGRGPVNVLAIDDHRFVVAPLWDNRVIVLSTDDARTLATHDLNFSPGALTFSLENLIIADAFGSQIAMINLNRSQEIRTRTVEGTNLAGLTVSSQGQELLIAHMIQASAGPINRTNIDWGLVISSKLSSYRISDFRSSKTEWNFRRLTLDGSRNGAADPSSVAVSPDGMTIVVASAGAHRLLKIDRRLGTAPAPDLLPLGSSLQIKECEVGDGPRSVQISPDGAVVVSANAFSSTLSFVDLASFQLLGTLAMGDSLSPRTAEERGEALFADGRLAMDRWMSCASCHPAGHTTGLNFDTLGDGDQGRPKSIPTLMGVRDTAPYAWTGQFRDLASQVESSIQTSQHGGLARPADVADITAYLMSLEPPPPIHADSSENSPRGASLFSDRLCVTCHTPPHFTSRPLRDVGFTDGQDAPRRYSPPSLRGVARTSPYLHDGRAATIDQVLRIHHPGFVDPPTDVERQALREYVESL